MKDIKWDPEKNRKLKQERGVSFDAIVACIENKEVLEISRNLGKKYRNQMVFVVKLNKYVYYVPFVEGKDEIFLKTIIPSRKLTKKHLKEK